MFALLHTKRWIGFTALVVFIIIAFGFLSYWKLSRAQAKYEEKVALEIASTVKPESLPTATELLGAAQWNRFTVTGTFDTSTQVVVRKRPLNGTNGYWVMTLFTERSGQTVWVNRGWFAASGAATTMPTIVPAPNGEQSIVGVWRFYENSEKTDLQGLPTGMIPNPGRAVLPVEADSPGYLQLTAPSQEGLIAIPTPEIDEVQNISYAVQWVLFALVAMIGWFIFLRREAEDDEKRALLNQLP